MTIFTIMVVVYSTVQYSAILSTSLKYLNYSKLPFSVSFRAITWMFRCLIGRDSQDKP
jgi:hypothetical protein